MGIVSALLSAICIFVLCGIKLNHSNLIIIASDLQLFLQVGVTELSNHCEPSQMDCLNEAESSSSITLNLFCISRQIQAAFCTVVSCC